MTGKPTIHQRNKPNKMYKTWHPSGCYDIMHNKLAQIRI